MILTDRDSGSRFHDVSNDVMKSSIFVISNDDITGTGRPINLV